VGIFIITLNVMSRDDHEPPPPPPRQNDVLAKQLSHACLSKPAPNMDMNIFPPSAAYQAREDAER
jgi:hypothetical protein